MSDAYETPAEQKARTESLGQLFGEVTKDVSTLMRQEIALAKAEVSDSAKKAGTGAGLYGGAGYAGLMAVLFLSLALWWGLADLIESVGWAAVIVAVIWGIAAGVLFVLGRKEMKTVKGAPQTVDSLKKIPETLKKNEENR